jgi:hypothetical protein
MELQRCINMWRKVVCISHPYKIPLSRSNIFPEFCVFLEVIFNGSRAICTHCVALPFNTSSVICLHCCLLITVVYLTFFH